IEDRERDQAEDKQQPDSGDEPTHDVGEHTPPSGLPMPARENTRAGTGKRWQTYCCAPMAR
ncbi:MAG TPA: hypothetical protein VEQ66_14435, partial [Propionibacteriaceae bacterium]|nr:hypothetical protein [Propionibacteriaceae bacterium]